MENIEQLTVFISLNGKHIEVGELVTDNKKIYFKYYPGFIKTGLQISPFKMELSDQILSAKTTVFDGLFGVFNDSLPDGWGRLLLDRTLLSKGIAVNQITALDRLAYVGSGGMGALIYEPEISSEYRFENQIELDKIAKEMNHVLEGIPTDVIEELYSLGGTSGGARPKINVGYNSKTEHIIHGKNMLPKQYEHWIIKFRSLTDLPDIANIEYAYYKMALDAGIAMSESKLFTTNSGKHYFGTKRFDREHNNRLHLHSVSGLLHDNFRYSNLDYGHVMDCAFTLENHVEAYAKVLRLSAFNVYSHNRDDHSKNISFLMNYKGDWGLAPAYDLTFSSSSHGMHSTMIAGESKSPGKIHLLKLAKTFGIKKPDAIIEQVQYAISNWKRYAKDCGVSKVSTQLISKAMRQLKD